MTPDLAPVVHFGQGKSMTCEKEIRPYGFRWIGYDEKRGRLQLQGDFTAADLRNLADWLEDPDHPVLSEAIPLIQCNLSPI